jgi:phosphoglucosamine mutase
MTRKYFGTDGVRGRVGQDPIVPQFVMHLGYAAGKVLASADWHLAEGERPTVLIGKDTRISGYMLEGALQSGLSAAGVHSLLTGPMPTPAVAYLTRALRLQAGIVISASHNPYEDNGIKFFSADGNKLPDSIEAQIEAGLESPIRTMPSAQLGRARRITDAVGRYIEFCKSTFPTELDLRGLRVVVDCAHGATYHIAPHVFHELGAEVITIGNEPNGFNINDGCGATQPQAMRAAVRQHRADIGIALDGDGDRLLMVDGKGIAYDGDQLLYVIARERMSAGTMKGGVVGTLMTNLALEHAFARDGVQFGRAKVGDRYVLEQLVERGWQIGGEGSGHIICLDKHTTGDGIVAALQVLKALRTMNCSLSDAVAGLTLYPQVLINVRMAKTFDFRSDAEVREAVQSAEADLAGTGRVLLRASGTEPVIRVMVEGQSQEQVQGWADRIAKVVRKQAAHQPD